MISIAVETARVQKLIAGIAKRFPNASSLTFGGVTYTSQTLTQLFQGFVTVLGDVIAAEAVLKSKVVAEKAQSQVMRALVGAFTAYVRVTFGNQPEALADFGVLPVKVKTPLTVEEKTKKVAKALATRAARHTLGKKQKAKITGQVPATTPAAAPAPGVVPVNKG